MTKPEAETHGLRENIFNSKINFYQSYLVSLLSVCLLTRHPELDAIPPSAPDDARSQTHDCSFNKKAGSLNRIELITLV